MKRVKCYGRMKTAYINTAARKVFYGANAPPLSDFSFGSDDDDFVPQKQPKKTPGFRKKADSVADHLNSPQLFSSCELENTDQNKENGAPAKPKPKKRGKGKKPVKKKTKVAKAEPPVNVKEPRWSIILEHNLQVEGNLVGSKRCAIPSGASPFRQSCTAHNVESRLLSDEPSGKQVGSESSTSSKAVAGGSGLRLRNVNHACDPVQQPNNREPRSSKCIRSKPGVSRYKGALSRKVSGGCGMGLRSLRRKSVAKSDLSSVLKNSLTRNATNLAEISPGGETRTEICTNADQSVTRNTEKSLVKHVSNSVNQSGILEDSLNCNSVGITETSRKSEPPQTKMGSAHSESDMATISYELSVSHTSNVVNQNSVLQDSLNCDFSGVNEIVPTNEIPTEMSNCNAEKRSRVHLDPVNSPALDPAVDVSSNISTENGTACEKENKGMDFAEKSFSFLKPKSHARYSTPDMLCIRKSSSTLNKIFEITNLGSGTKNFPIVTSTPNMASRMRFPQKMSMFNLSRICSPEKNHSMSKRADLLVSKTSIYLQSGMYDNTASVSFVPRKARSLDLLVDSMKPSGEHDQLSSPSQTQPESKSRKSCSCIEKVPSNKSLLSCSDVNQSRSGIEKLLEVCDQETIKPFADAYDWNLVKVQKVGEGTYGEVFMLSLKKKASVIKIIPVSQDATNTWMDVDTVYSEVKVCQCLSKLRNNSLNKTSNFNKLNGVHFVKGRYPAKLLTAWDTFCTVKSCYNVRPDCFEEEQLYVILDMEYGGTDMSSFVMKNAVEAESILKQVAISLAIAEETHLFEHRDLHLGNILVQRTKKRNIFYVLRGQSISIPSHGVMVTIIDFTLSRIFESGCVYYNNLADDKSLFDQSGDYQFEIYRATRDHLKNQWQEGSLFSNVLWLTFLCVKLTEYRYVRPTSVVHIKSFNNIAVFQSNLKSCKSAFDCLTMCKILSSVPKGDQSVQSILKGKAVFVDRKSFQKSKHSII